MRITRRRALRTAGGVIGTVLLAGCAETDDDSPSNDTESNGESSDTTDGESNNDSDDGGASDEEPEEPPEPWKDVTEQVGPGVDTASIVVTEVTGENGDDRFPWHPHAGAVTSVSNSTSVSIIEDSEVPGISDWQDKYDEDFDDDRQVVYIIESYGQTTCDQDITVEELAVEDTEASIHVRVTEGEDLDDDCDEEDTFVVAALLVHYSEDEIPEQAEITVEESRGLTAIWGVDGTYGAPTLKET